MDEVVVVSDSLEHACRLCLTTGQKCSSIFNVPDASVPFAEKIRAYLSIKVTSNDKLPTLVCSSCIKTINHWHTYKDTCLKAQEKLQQWFSGKSTTVHPLVTVKEEPLDEECMNSQVQVTRTDISNHVEANTDDVQQSNAVPTTSRVDEGIPEQPSRFSESMDVFSPEVQIKTEPMDTEDEDNCNIDVESVNSGELLLNPMAIAAQNAGSNNMMMEADAVEKFRTRRFITRKIKRRGPHTHFRGVKLFKKKCSHCSIYLHSKYSYAQHMSRYHGIVNSLDSNDCSEPVQPVPVQNKQKSKLTHHVDSEEQIENSENVNSEDLEFAKMIKTDPLTPVQKTIIGQLKTFSCYACKQTFFDRRHTLNHIRQHMPDLRPYTCIACLTEFSDRSMYKLHCGASFECAMKIALVVPKIGYEKYFTCNMCLKAFNNRRELLTHLAIHADKQHKQLSQPIRSPGKLNSSGVPGTGPQSHSVPAGPYMNGDPAHNHMCDLCGMIYRYRPNMVKHRDLCSTLLESIRTSYRCIQCNMTYLVFKKFYTHIVNEHKKREITCFICHEKFLSPDEFLAHHETHRVYSGKDNSASQEQQEMDGNYSADSLDASNHLADTEEKFNCALCGENFDTKHELSEHRNLHLKVKIYSCVVCRSMFSSSIALESHMKVHGFDDASKQTNNAGNNALNESAVSAASDPGPGLHHCYQCGKNFSNYANLKRHERNLHLKVQQKIWTCDICKDSFTSSQELEKHRWVHSRRSHQMKNTESTSPKITSPTGKPFLQCPKCPKTFIYQGNLIQHCQNVHKENHFERIARQSAPPARQSAPPAPAAAPAPPPPRPRGGYACDICGKSFKEEQSMKTHKGWHLRTNYRLKSDQNISMDDNLLSGSGINMPADNSPKPAKARKSFPNNPSQKQLNNIGSLQCQVCDDRFNDVTTLRHHLWDVHCARNKPERIFTSELQCELCTTRFNDDKSLQEHMKWHSQNPILSNHSISKTNNEVTSEAGTPSANYMMNRKYFRCETCGKNYSNRKMYVRHKKLHKTMPAATMMNLQSLQKSKSHYCHTCHKNFATDTTLRRHKASPCHLSVVRSQTQAPTKKDTVEPPSEYMDVSTVKEEPGSDYSGSSSTTGQLQMQPAVSKKKEVTCSICRTSFPNLSVLHQHKQLVHRSIPSSQGFFRCNVCGKKFPGLANLKLHFAHKHKPKSTFPCTSPGCKLIFNSNSALKNHENTHTSMIYNCLLCDRHVFSKVAMTKHMLALHKEVYHQSGGEKSYLWTETDLTNYTVKNCQSTACPKCKVKYPNLKALKIHYLKFHDKT